MKKWLLFLMTVLVLLLGCSSCKSWKREKITDPAQQKALQTRSAEVPIDSLFTVSAAKLVLSPFARISFVKFRDEYKNVYASSEEVLQREAYMKDLIKGKGNNGKKMEEKAAEREAAKADAETLSTYRIGAYDRFDYTYDNLPGEGYSVHLTFLFGLLLALFTLVFLGKVIYTFFITPKR